MCHLYRCAVALTALLAASCGPIYETEYRYTPPAASEAQSCVSQCEVGKRQCRSSAELKTENRQLRCEKDAANDYELCFTRAGNDQDRNRCQRKSCSSNTHEDQQLCEDDHRVCFQGCGGVVETQRVCTFNCP